jgi:adenylylsulfate kinase-like enzyme
VDLSSHEGKSPGAQALLIITGSMGSGKTTVMGEASDILAARGIAHAAIDLDWLGIAHLGPEAADERVKYLNLHCVWENYRTLGLTRLLLARAMETREDVESCRAAVGDAKTVICRLTANMATMEQRVRMRDTGVGQQEYVQRVAVLNAVLDGARLEDFSVTNENRPVTDVAQEVLVRAGWL